MLHQHIKYTFSLLSKATVSCSNSNSYSKKHLSTLVFQKYGKPSEVLSSIQTVGTANIKGDEVKINVKASLITSEDIRHITGISLVNKSTGTAGTNGVGFVKSIGSNVQGITANDTVLAIGCGLWSDDATVSASNVVKIPNDIKAEEAANLPSYVSAWGLLKLTGASGDDIIVQTNGDSISGKNISSIGKALGLKVLNVSATELADDKKVAALGNVKVILSPTSNKSIHGFSKVLAQNGKLIIYNDHMDNLYGDDCTVSLPVASTIFKNISITGYDFNSWATSNHDGLKEGVSSIISLYKDKKLTAASVSKVIAQADFKQAVASVSADGIPIILKL